MENLFLVYVISIFGLLLIEYSDSKFKGLSKKLDDLLILLLGCLIAPFALVFILLFNIFNMLRVKSE